MCAALGPALDRAAGPNGSPGDIGVGFGGGAHRAEYAYAFPSTPSTESVPPWSGAAIAYVESSRGDVRELLDIHVWLSNSIPILPKFLYADRPE